MELLGKLLSNETLPGFGLSIDINRTFFSERGLSHTVQQTRALAWDAVIGSTFVR